MAKKTKSSSKSKGVKQKKSAPKKSENEMFDAVLASFRGSFPIPIDNRKELLARVAGTVAAGLVTSPSPSIGSASAMATAAVDIAEEILLKVGIPATEIAVEPVVVAAPAAVDDLGVAS